MATSDIMVERDIMVEQLSMVKNRSRKLDKIQLEWS